MKLIKSFLVLVVLAFVSLAYAQDSKSIEDTKPVSISCDLMSRYVWRGIDFGASPSIQPGIEYSNNGFTVGAWGSYSIGFQGYQESDIYLGYTFFKDMLSFTITDYYFQTDVDSQRYFNYKANTTGHVLEASMAFNGTTSLPLSLMLATNIYGADAKRINEDGSIGSNQFSTYAELSYSLKYLDVFVGANLTNPNTERGESAYYGSEVGIINLGLSATKDISLTKTFSLPLSFSLITNPQAEKVYFVAGFSF